ncbi:hypothetical protein ACEWY4_015787 [Coilia grayii]|uniref:KH homology domain-containing protein 4 n=1 Tax=Coilia grayii TaxID=363190 RepID=A0ABD1JP00_9TELE
MASGTPCLSRWDQPKSKADMRQSCNVSQSLSSSTSNHTGGHGITTTTSTSQTSSCPAPDSNMPPTSRGPAAEEDAPQGGVEMAAAMAAKINAMLMAKGKLKPLEPLPSKIAPSAPVSSTTDEVVVTEVDINDVPINCRNLLTKGKTQEEIRQFSGAVVSTKGLYMTNADKSTAKGERPLYLHVQGRSQEEVNKAVQRIKEIISEDLMRAAAASGGQQRPVMPMLPVYPQPPRPIVPQQPPRLQMPHMPRPPNAQHNQRSSSSHHGGHSGNFCHTKIFVGLDQALPSFNVNEKVEGPGGTYLGHIQTETGARVFLRGKGSGYIEQASRRESFEPLYVYISHPNQVGLEAAKKLTESLLETVRAEHSRMVSIYTATGSTQAYPAHGYPANSNYSSQGSWYNYPANGFPGCYSAYPGATGYWGSANGQPSHSNLSTTPQSSQAMVQYPVCPRKPPPYLVQDPAASSSDATSSPSTSPPRTDSPRRQFVEDTETANENETESGGGVKHEEQTSPPPPPGSSDGGKTAERFLMPPPPMPPPPMPLTAARKRQRESPPKEELPSPAAGKAPFTFKRCPALC